MFIVDMWYGRHWEEGYRYFSCGGDTWDRALALAKEHGWQSMGTIPGAYVDKPFSEYGVTNDYEVEDFAKAVRSEDANALANALDKALVAIREGGMKFPESACARIVSDDDAKDAEYRQASSGISPQFLEEFIAFLRKGEFNFSWDD